MPERHRSTLTVAIDAEHFRQADAGIARYARGLAAALRLLGGIDVLELGGGPLLERGTLEKRLTTLHQDLLWYPVLGRRKAAAARADVYHCPLPRGPLSRGKPPLVITVHDLVPVRFPETMTAWSRLHSKATFGKVLDAADLIITPSADTAQDLERLMRVSGERIRVIPNGIDDRFFRPAPPSDTDKPPYVLVVGTPEPRKNLPRLAAAMRELRSRGFAERLVIAGSGGWGAAVPREPGIEWVGRVSDDRLHSLYAAASCVVVPSLHEGFGLTALEAMAVGTPVVVSRAGALPEVVADAAVLVDPLSVTAIADGILRSISERDMLIARGRRRAAQFTWEACARGTAGVYREIA